MTKFGAKIARYFWAIIFKNYFHILNQHPEICLIANFIEKLIETGNA